MPVGFGEVALAPGVGSGDPGRAGTVGSCSGTPGRPSTVDRAAAGAGVGVGPAAGVRPPTATVTSPATVSTVASATHRRRQYTVAGSGPTGSHIHSLYRSDYSE